MSEPKAPLPTEMDPGCTVCTATWEALLALLKSGENIPVIEGQLGVQHVLDAIGLWWIGTALAHTGGDPRPILELVGLVCQQNGIPVAVTKVNIADLPGAMPMASGGNRAH